MRETKIKTNQIDYDFDGHGGGAESVTLLSITTAPQAPFKAGDRFYSNEETEQFEANVIYKAVVDNSWEYAEALTPELGVFYIFDGETYLYDAKIESLFKIGDSTSSNELYILNESLPANTTTLETTVDFGENFLINVYINGLLQTKDLHYYVSGTDIIFTSGFDEAVNVTILYTSSSDVNINNTPTGTVNYNELINKPKINNIDLIGNKTSDNLGLQDKLVSGTNIKTINSNSILGSGDITISGSNVIELTEGTNIDNLKQEGTFFIKNPTGTLPSAVSTSGTHWCVVTQEKCYDDLNLGTYWYLQTVKFTYLGMGPGMGTLPSWQTYTRQITDYQYTMGNMWQRLDNVAEKVFSVSLANSNANVTINLSSYSNDEYLSVVSVGMISSGDIRTVSTLNLDSGLSGSCRIIFKTGSGTFSINMGAYISAQLLNADILTNYSFKSNTLYDIHFQKTSQNNSYSVQVTEIDKPFVQEYFPTQTGNNGKFLSTDGSSMSWQEVDALPSQSGQSGKYLTTDGTTASWQTVDTLPDQTGQAGKFLTTDGTDASWAEVQNNFSTITYFDSTNWTLDPTNTILSTGLSLGNNVNVFKNGQLLQPGAFNSVSTTVGNPTIQNGISSNMNTSNYVRFLRANYLLDNDWEICLKVYWDGSSTNVYASISDYATANYFRIESSGGFSFNGYLTNNNSVWVHHASCFHYKPAGWYYIALKYTYSTGDFAIYSGTSPENMVQNYHVEKGEHMQLRNLTSSKYVFSQSPAQIDLKESYVKVGEDKYPIIFKNDYIVDGNNINFTDELESTDKVAVINGNMNPMQSVGYNTFSNKSILATDWVADNTYSGYSYKCDIPCTGVTSTMYAQVTFAPEEAMSGNYANICDTGTGVVTIYSKVAEAITIPMIMVLGV